MINEHEYWQMTIRRNQAGLRFDIPFLEKAWEVVNQHKTVLWGRLAEATGGKLQNTRAPQATRLYLKNHCMLDMPNLKAETVELELAQEMTPLARQVLETHRDTGLTSTAKIKKILDIAMGDKVYGLTTFRGALATGRNTSVIVNVANFPRGRKGLDVDQAIADIIAFGYDGALRHGNPVEVVKGCLRGSIIPDEGHDFVCVDYSSIEAVLAMFLADAPIYRQMKTDPGLLYLKTASALAGTPVTDAADPWRKKGKVASLAGQYQTWVVGFRKLATSLGWKEVRTMTNDQVAAIVGAYRNAYPELTHKDRGIWAVLNRAAISAMHAPGREIAVAGGKIVFCYVAKSDSLGMGLPSGRVIWMPYPQLKHGGRRGVELTFMRYMFGKWVRNSTYGGSLFESACQGLSRDIMVAAEMRAEAAGYRVLNQIYDEAVCQVPEGRGSPEHLAEIMCEQTDWMKHYGLVVHADGWRGKRYRKG